MPTVTTWRDDAARGTVNFGGGTSHAPTKQTTNMPAVVGLMRKRGWHFQWTRVTRTYSFPLGKSKK